MEKEKTGGRAKKERLPQYDTNGKELFDVGAMACWVSGIGSGNVSDKNTSGVPVAKVIM